jgi:SAM-dependent methyltransferase
MNRLTEIANKHVTDKGIPNVPGINGHNYTETYFKYLPTNPQKILEIGVRHGCSLRMWSEYYPDIQSIYGIDFCVEITVEHLKSIQNENKKFKLFYGDQSNRKHLEDISNVIGKEQLDFVLDDGSHCTDHQQISLANLLHLVKPKGLYIIEDLTDKIYPQGGWNIKDLVNYSDATVNVLDNFSKTGKFVSPYLSKEEMEYLENNIEKVVLELRQGHNLAFIYKK